MHHGVEAREIGGLDRAHVLLDRANGLAPRTEGRPPVQVGVHPDDVMARLDHHRSHRRPDISTAPGQQDSHVASPIWKAEAYRTFQSGRLLSNGSRPQYLHGQLSRSERSPSWMSSIESLTGLQRSAFATFVRTSRSIPETTRYPPVSTSRARFRRQLSASGGSMWQRKSLATTRS